MAFKLLDLLRIRPVEDMDDELLNIVLSLDDTSQKLGYLVKGIGTLDKDYVIVFTPKESDGQSS